MLFYRQPVYAHAFYDSCAVGRNERNLRKHEFGEGADLFEGWIEDARILFDNRPYGYSFGIVACECNCPGRCFRRNRTQDIRRGKL